MYVNITYGISNIFYYLVIDCGPLFPPANGALEISSTTFSSTANYTCDAGFLLNASETSLTRMCMENSQWSSMSPACNCKEEFNEMIKYTRMN